MITPEQFERLFSPEGLRPFVPEPGSTGMEPLLEVLFPQSLQVYILACDLWNEGDGRQQIIYSLGAQCAETGPVLYVRLGSEAWSRAFRMDEDPPGERSLETYKN